MRIYCARGALLASASMMAIMSSVAGTQAAGETALGGSADLTLSSPDIADGTALAAAQLFNAFGCTGSNVSPALTWRNAPAGTKSFALLAYDPDAPTGSGWWHWVVYNIPANARSLPADAGDSSKKLTPGATVQGRTDYGTAGYGGPCPPPGNPHRYIFRLYALKVAMLNLPAEPTAALVGFNVNANALGVAQIMSVYGR